MSFSDIGIETPNLHASASWILRQGFVCLPLPVASGHRPDEIHPLVLHVGDERKEPQLPSCGTAGADVQGWIRDCGRTLPPGRVLHPRAEVSQTHLERRSNLRGTCETEPCRIQREYDRRVQVSDDVPVFRVFAAVYPRTRGPSERRKVCARLPREFLGTQAAEQLAG